MLIKIAMHVSIIGIKDMTWLTSCLSDDDAGDKCAKCNIPEDEGGCKCDDQCDCKDSLPFHLPTYLPTCGDSGEFLKYLFWGCSYVQRLLLITLFPTYSPEMFMKHANCPCLFV
jgi:hypothetical protein